MESPPPLFPMPSILHLTSCRVRRLPAPPFHFPSSSVDLLVSHLWPFFPTYQVIFLNQKHAHVPPCFKPVRGSPLDKSKLSSMSFTTHWAPGSAIIPLPATCEAHSVTPSCSEFSAHGAFSLLCFASPALLAEIPSSAHLTCKAQGRYFIPCLTFTSQGELMHTLIALHFHDVSFPSLPHDGWAL